MKKHLLFLTLIFISEICFASDNDSTQKMIFPLKLNTFLTLPFKAPFGLHKKMTSLNHAPYLILRKDEESGKECTQEVLKIGPDGKKLGPVSTETRNEIVRTYVVIYGLPGHAKPACFQAPYHDTEQEGVIIKINPADIEQVAPMLYENGTKYSTDDAAVKAIEKHAKQYDVSQMQGLHALKEAPQKEASNGCCQQ